MNKKRFLSALLTLVMLVGMLPTGALAARIDDGAVPMEAPSDETDRLAVPVWEDAEAPAQGELAEVDTSGLVNIASQCELVSSSTGSAYQISNICDGNRSTLWGANRGFPGHVVFNLPAGVGKVKHVILFFEQGHSSWGMDVTLFSGDNQIDKQTVTSFDDTYVYTFSEAQTVSSLKVLLENPTSSGAAAAFWPAIAEAEIWAEPLDLSTLTNIAKGMSPTLPNNNRVTDNSGNLKANLTDDSNDTEFEMYGAAVPPGAAGVDGACFMEFDFGENRKIGGFEFVVSTALAASYTYKYNIYGRANGVTQWTEYVKDVPVSHAAGQNAKQHPFASLTDLRYVRVVLHSGNQWGAVSEFRIFGEAKPDIPEPDDPVYGGLKDLAPLSTITVPSYENNNKRPENMVDGNLSTQWNTSGASWPCEVMFALPGNAKVKRVEINFENHSNRSMRVTLNSAFNSVTSDMSTILGPTQHTMSETLVFADDSDEGTLMSHLQIVLDNPLTNGAAGAFWPNIAEVKIWAIDEAVDLNKYADITSYAGESTTGSDYKEWDFKSNQQIAGFKVTLPDGVTGVLKGRLKRDKTYTTYIQTLKNGDNILDYITGMSAVRVELSDPSQLTGFQIWGTYT